MTKIRLVFKYAFKDLGRQKVRTSIGIIGVLISVGMLALILFLTDTISFAFVDYLSIDAGNQDMVVSIRHYNGEPDNRSSYFSYAPVIETIQGASSDIEKIIPRMELTALTNISGSQLQKRSVVSGINFSLEKSLEFGSFSGAGSQLNDLNSLPTNHCAIYHGFNDLLGYSVNDTVEVVMTMIHGNETIIKTVNLTIDYIFNFEFKWPSDYRSDNLLVVDINTTYTIFGYEEFKGKCNKLILTLQEGGMYYDIRDLDGTEIEIVSIASTILLNLGLSEYEMDLPKMSSLGFVRVVSMGLQMIFIFVTIIMMLISGVLINGLLKTSVEERIREFGIFRTLGAHKSYNLAIVLVQGFLLCGIGSFLGVMSAWILNQYLIIPLVSDFLVGGMPLTLDINFADQFISFILPFGMGVSVGMLVSISPALKVMKLQLIESIHPYRHEDTLYHIQKKSTVNVKLIVVGLILAINGGFIFFVIPRIMVSMDLTLMASTLIVILLIFLIGLTLAGLGLMPLFLRLMIEIFRPLSNKLHNIIKIFVFRYQRRNSSTIIMFALSFSFVIFTTTIIQDQVAQLGITTNLRIGSDLLLTTSGWQESSSGGGGLFGGGSFGFGSIGGGTIISEEVIDPTKVITSNRVEEIYNLFDGIEKISSVIASPEHLTEIYSSSDKGFSADLGDYAGISTQGISLIGIDEQYFSTVNNDYMTFRQGNKEAAFETLFQQEYSCIISEAIGINLDVNINEKVRISITRGDEKCNYIFTLIGRASTMPGFMNEFGGTSFGASMGGVLISQEVYLDLFGISEVAYCDKIFIKIQENKKHLSSNIKESIDDNYQNIYTYEISDLAQSLADQQSLFSTIDTLFSIILMSTVIIALFGLISSSYSTIIERKQEVGIVRTLGLKGRDISRMFIIEALIIMFASGTIGLAVGYATGWLLTSNMSLMTDIPATTSFPVSTALNVYVLSTIFIIIGMVLLLRKLRRKKIIEIYRETA